MVEIRVAAQAEVRPLQLAVLRPNGPVPGDGPWPAGAMHIGAFVDGEAVAAVTLLLSPWQGPGLLPVPAWQLRSMAVDPDRQGTGLGRQVLARAEQEAHEHGAATLWAAVRVAALGFYEGAGWTAVGQVWDKDGVGPHRWAYTVLD